MSDIASAIQGVRARIATAARRVGRDPGSVALMAVSKTVPAMRVQEAVDAGIHLLGENRVQEAGDKIPRVTGPVAWHLIGKLQRNKARRAATLFDAVHSLDRMELIPRLDEAAGSRGRVLDIYVQVEYVRAGIPEPEVEPLVRDLCVRTDEAVHLNLVGLMTLPPFDADPETARPWFRRLRELRDRLRASTGLALPGLSMGMSNDFEVAIEEGSTIVRVGTAIFGARSRAPSKATPETIPDSARR